MCYLKIIYFVRKILNKLILMIIPFGWRYLTQEDMYVTDDMLNDQSIIQHKRAQRQRARFGLAHSAADQSPNKHSLSKTNIKGCC